MIVSAEKMSIYVIIPSLKQMIKKDE
ncbi:hypothetical protein MED297_18703 [Reinekea sp. MED297]|uniref:Uncharacterized protein n=1 Tax=Reinekea blandensis MED297 TaxID=314283 RepID=A4BF12_9GAMM|nr:hypothetical protein MED297_18703 [Reinekea sp. MED297] [Reinekea blandensis MED297]